MAHPRIHSPPSLGEPLVTLKSSGLQGVVSWLHSVVRGFASNLEAEKQQWESQAQELRGETRDLRRRLETLEGSSLPDARHDSTESGDLAEQMRALERRVDLWREEQLLRREMETGDVSKSAAAAPVDASYVEAMKQDLRESFESLLEDKVQTLQLSLQQRLGDTGEELSQLLQVHAASMGERLRICEERIAALAFGALQAPSEAADSEPKEEQRRPGSTGSGASNAGGASLESRVARLERNVKGLAAFASTSDAQRMDDLAMTVKQAQLDSRRCTERIQQLEAHAHQASQPDSQLLQMIKDLEQRIREEMQELKQEVENKISSEEKMDRGILEEVHRDLLSPVAPSSKSLGLGGFDLDFPAKPQTPSTAEVASLHTKMQVMAEQQDDRALHLDQELKKLQQQLFEVQVGTATTATGGDSTAVGDNGSKAASALAGTLAKHEEELKNLSASVSALQASVGQAMSSPTRSQDEAGRRVEADSPGDATSLTLALQKAEEAQRRVASLQTEVSRLAEAVEALRAEAKLSDQDREQLRVPEGLDKETLQDVRDDLLGLDTKEEKPENEVPDVADVADAADAELVKPQASSGEKPALEKPTEPAAASSEALPGEEALAERVASLEQKVSSLDESLQTLTEKVSPASDAPSSGADDPRVKDDTSPVPEGLEADALQRLKELETKVAELAQKTAGETPPAQVAEEASAEADARPEASPETKPEATADAVPEAAPETEAPEVTAAAEVRPGVEPDSAAHEEIAKLWKEVQKLSEAVADLQKEAESKEIHPPGEDDEEAGSNPLDELKQEVSTLSGNLVALQDSQGTLQEEVKRLAAAMESDQVSKLAEEVQSLRRHVDDGEPQVANPMEELQSLRQHLDEGEPAQKVESLAETLKQLQESHHDLHQKVENVGTREAEVSDLKKQVQSLGDTVTRTVEAVSARNESLSEVPKLKEALESLKRRQEEFNLQIEATQRKQLNAIREDMRVVQASQEAAAKRQAQIKEGTQSLEKEQLQLASKLRQLENGRLKQLGQDMQVVKEAILHVQQELKKEVVIPEHILKDLDDKNEARLEAIWKELHSHAEAAATRADRIEQSLTQRVVHLESATTRLVKAEEHTRSLEQDMQKQSEWFAWRIAWLEWATTGEKRSFARALLPPPSTPAATCFKQPLTEDSELWAQEKAGPRRLRRAPLHNMPNAGTANGSALSGSSSAPDLQATGKGQGTRLPDLR